MSWFNSLRLKPKLILLFLLVGLIPLAITAWVSLYNADKALEHAAMNQLESVETLKRDQVEIYFQEALSDLKVYSQNSAVRQAATRFFNAYEEEGGTSGEMWSQWDDFHGSKMNDYIEIYGFYDLFVINTAGDVAWTATQEADLGQNVNGTMLRGSGLHEAWQQGLKGTSFIDFTWYDVSNEPASFISTPLEDLETGEVIGVMAYQLSLEAIDAMMHSREGMGETGETFLVGPDFRMRSNSYLDPDEHSIVASFEGTIERNGAQTEAVKRALRQETGVDVLTDYNGNAVVSAYSPLTLPGGVTWAVVANITMSEVDKPLVALRNKVFLIGFLIALAVGILAFLIARSLANPILFIVEGARRLSRGDAVLADLDPQQIEAINNRADELGEIGKEFTNLIGYFKHKTEVAERFAKGDLEVEVNIASEQDQLAHALVGLRSSLQGIANEVNTVADQAIKGRLDARGDVARYDGAFADLLSGINGTVDTLVSHLDNVPTPVMLIDTNFSIQYLNKAGLAMLGAGRNGVIGNKCYDHFKTGDCNTGNCACARTMKSGVVENRETQANPNGQARDIAYSGVAIKDRNGAMIGALEVITDQTDIKQAQRRDEAVARYQSGEVAKLQHVLETMSTGDLTVNYQPAEADAQTQATRDTFEQIAGGLNASLTNLNDILNQVRLASEQISSGSEQVSDSSQTLSQGATEQASSLEEISSALVELDSQTSQNADNALQANTLAGSARDVARTGNEQMSAMLNAMTDINAKSSEVQRIIKVIDEIAFQTNLLALNAAVEAARAGVHGKGFAVVAEEVRSLAQRSAKAASETTELIEGNMSSVKNGSNIAEGTAKSLAAIEEAITKATDLVNEIASASKEQTVAVSEVNSSLGQIDQVTQSNAANAEESAAASEELAGQSNGLLEMLQRFQLTEGSQYGERRSLQVSGAHGQQRQLPSRDHEMSDDVAISLDDDEFGRDLDGSDDGDFAGF